MRITKGIRQDLQEDEYFLDMGGYGKNPEGKWYCRVPEAGFSVGGLGNHVITEHEDNTITVSPSILSIGHNNKQWHGWLERGIWREI